MYQLEMYTKHSNLKVCRANSTVQYQTSFEKGLNLKTLGYF